MNRFFRYLAVLFAVIAVIAFVTVRLRKQPDSANREAAPKSIHLGEHPSTPGPDSKNEHVPQTPAARLDEVLAQLATSEDGNTNRKLLAELRQFLDGLPAEIASREVQSFLAASKDAPTKLDVTVKPGGMLGDASSLRSICWITSARSTARRLACSRRKSFQTIPHPMSGP